LENGIIFDIQRFSVNNGSGIRSTAFLKGCPLRCKWCHNPEAFEFKPQLKYTQKLCRLCGSCVRTCPTGAIKADDKRVTCPTDTLSTKYAHIIYAEQLCKRCFACVGVCPYGAMKSRGYGITSEELVRTFLRDKEYFDESGGGITLSGGEPTAQPKFTLEVLSLSREAGLSTCTDTCGYCGEKVFREILELSDIILFDLKHMDFETHKNLTGVGNDIILQNLKSVCDSGKQLRIRYPMIPNLNDSDENIAQMCGFLRKLNIRDIDVSVFHDYYTAKYEQMFRPDNTPSIRAYTAEEIDERLQKISACGIEPKRI